MPDVDQVHPSQRLTTPTGEAVEIDVDMVPLVKALWAMGLHTAASCQNLGESIMPGHGWASGEGRRRHAHFQMGQAWLKMPADDAMRMLDILIERQPMFRERLHRWTRRDAWECYAYMQADGASTVLSEWVQIHFPAAQIPEVVMVLTASDFP